MTILLGDHPVSGVKKVTHKGQGIFHHVTNEKVRNVLGDRKEEVVTIPFPEKKSLTKYVFKGTDELADTLLMDNKSLTKDVEKSTNELSDTLLMDNKSLTKGVEKGTY